MDERPAERTWTADDLPPFGEGWEVFVRATRTAHSDGRVSHSPVRYAELPLRPAMLFPAGVGYREAVTSLHAARHGGRPLAPGAELTDPLPAGVCVEVRADGRIALDPAAPLGFHPSTGAVKEPAFILPADWSDEETKERFAEQQRRHLPLPRGARLLIEPLDPSQVLVAEDQGHLGPSVP